MTTPRPLNADDWIKSVESRVARLERRVGPDLTSPFNQRETSVLTTTHLTSYTIGNPSSNPFDPMMERTVRIVRTAGGIVTLQGLFQVGGTLGPGITLLTLPDGYRPDTRMRFIAVRNNGYVPMEVLTDGRVSSTVQLNAGDYINFDNIVFPAAGVATWTNLTTINGWAAFDTANFGQPRYWKDPAGFTWMAGLVVPGTITDGTVIANLPSGAMPPTGQRQYTIAAHGAGSNFTSISGGLGTQLEIRTGVVAGASNWVSLSGLSWATADAFSANTWITPGKGNGWLRFDTNTNDFQVTQRADGLCMSVGIVRTGTVNSGIGPLPRNMQGHYRRTFATITSGNVFARLDIMGQYWPETARPGGWFIMALGSNTWFSVDNLQWFPDGL